MPEQTTLPAVAAHGARRLPSVDVDSYNVELKDSEGFIGDRASRGAFRDMIERIRKSLRKVGEDPFGDEDSDELTKAELDELLLRGEPEAAGIPGFIEEDGSIDRGAQNLPGNWESSRFNLPLVLHDMIPSIGGHETSIVMHNDAVVQGLSEIPFMQDVAQWGVLTIGTGLGNARFTNRDAKDE
jgi:Arc/MetJ-type ribon-helix-helix transcriptional regulator